MHRPHKLEKRNYLIDQPTLGNLSSVWKTQVEHFQQQGASGGAITASHTHASLR